MTPKAENKKALWALCALVVFPALLSTCSKKGGPGPLEAALIHDPAALCKEHGKTIGTALLLGDSNTARMPADILPGDYVNCGIMGNRSDQLVLQLPLYLSLYRPKTVSIMIGTNDIGQGRSLDAFLTDCSSLIATAERRGVVLLFRSIPPTSAGRAKINPATEVFSNALGQLLKKKNIAYADHRRAWKDRNGFLRADMTDDGLHLNRAGYDIIKEGFYTASTR